MYVFRLVLCSFCFLDCPFIFIYVFTMFLATLSHFCLVIFLYLFPSHPLSIFLTIFLSFLTLFLSVLSLCFSLFPSRTTSHLQDAHKQHKEIVKLSASTEQMKNSMNELAAERDDIVIKYEELRVVSKQKEDALTTEITELQNQLQAVAGDDLIGVPIDVTQLRVRLKQAEEAKLELQRKVAAAVSKGEATHSTHIVLEEKLQTELSTAKEQNASLSSRVAELEAALQSKDSAYESEVSEIQEQHSNYVSMLISKQAELQAKVSMLEAQERIRSRNNS